VIFTQLALPGAWVIEPERHHDERGFFARSFCADEFRARGLEVRIAQCSISYNRRRSTLRGLHFQAPPAAETKLVRCTAGAVFDVIVDLRPDSPTFKRWVSVELTAESRRSLYVPVGMAHGFQTLQDDTELFYQISHPFVPEAFRGVCWNDPELGVAWPAAEDRIISARDRELPRCRDLALP
jgi:dTDP-4-dehydrorhamnose 3,5-epimerase